MSGGTLPTSILASGVLMPKSTAEPSATITPSLHTVSVGHGARTQPNLHLSAT